LIKFKFDCFLDGLGIELKNIQITHLLEKNFLPFVEKPGRYLGTELNVIHKNLSDVNLRFAFAFPEVYEIAMSSQATGMIYHQLNRIKHFWAERVFAPWTDAEELLRKYQIPLFSLESFTPLNAFDIIGFTLQYELTYTNILNMLDLADIPLWANRRREKDPIIVGGGPCSCNPEPLAPYFDAFYIGDAEAGLVEFCEIVQSARQEGKSRKQILKMLAGFRGVYIPSFYQDSYDLEGNFSGLTSVLPGAPLPIKTRIVPELTNEYYPRQPLVPLIEVTHDRLAIEVMRGCTEGCRYCNAGMIYRPTRERQEDDIVSFTKDALSHTGYEEVSFLSLSISDYSSLNALMRKEREAMAGEQINFSFPSMRLDSFNEEIAAFAKTIRKSGFTFAPEAGSMRLRRVINKNISDDDLLKAVDIALNNGWKTLKFYFMIGLPTETKEDIVAIADLIERIIEKSKRFGKLQLNISISSHSPKSHTPFQWEKQDTKEEFKEKINLIKERIKKHRRVKLSWRDPGVSEIECILGRGDRRLAKVIYHVWKRGSRFDGWNDHFHYQEWEKALAESGSNINRLIEEKPEEAPLPWDHIDKGVTRHFLLIERKNAYNEVNSADCKDSSCYSCGLQRKNGFAEYTHCYTDIKSSSKEVPLLANKKIDSEEPLFVDSVEEIDSETVYHYRIHFIKEGFEKYLAHFDIVRAFERSCRRAQIKVVHSQGFNPRPKFAFGPPLRLGYSSEAEYVDLQVYAISAPLLMEQLNLHLPEGIRILNIIPISVSMPSLMASINAAEYQIKISQNKLSDAQIDKMFDESQIPVLRRVKGKEKKIDIRPYIESITPKDEILTIHTNFIEGRTARIGEILSTLFLSHPVDSRSFPVHRKSQMIKTNGTVRTPMDIR
jgi:radical SAM family uncharacterized protein/radical SAM-linked protein